MALISRAFFTCLLLAVSWPMTEGRRATTRRHLRFNPFVHFGRGPVHLLVDSPPSQQQFTVPGPRAGEPYGCRKVTPCICQTGDGRRVDLTPLANTNGLARFQAQDPGQYNYTYLWNPCYGFSQAGCENVAVCQLIPGYAPNHFSLGNQSSVDFEVSSNRGLMLQYTGEAGHQIAMRTTYVRLQCEPEIEAEFTSQGEIPALSGVYYMTLRSRNACLNGSHPTSPTTPTTLPTPGVVTITAEPTSNPIYSLETVVDLLFVLTIVAAVGLVVLLLVLVALCVSSGLAKTTDQATAPEKGRCALDAAGDAQHDPHNDKKSLLRV